jgi:hypothetical protein
MIPVTVFLYLYRIISICFQFSESEPQERVAKADFEELRLSKCASGSSDI